MTGSTTPRIWTPPLRDLSDPDATYGYELIDFAAAIGVPFDPWQEWLAIHVGELLPDGRPRFRMILALVARQNGKTTFARVLTLYWMIIDRARFVLGTSTSRDTAKVSWREVIDIARASDLLYDEFDWRVAIRETIGEEALTTLAGAQYRFAAPNRRAGRSFTVHRAILDELREHQDWEVYKAAFKAMTAVRDAQALAITNQGDDTAVVLDSLRAAALEHIETGAGDPRLGLFEWSSPTSASPTDPRAIAQANPNVGIRIEMADLLGEAARAQANGGEELTGFKTETMCMRVTLLDPAIDPDRWRDAGTDTPIDMATRDHRRHVALCLDVSLDAEHASLTAAAYVDGVVHLEMVKTWSGRGCTKQVRDDLPDLVAKIKPRAIGWFPKGPAAVVAASVKDRRPRRGVWPPRGVKVIEIKEDTPAVCMGFADIVTVGDVRHPRDPLLSQHVAATQKLWRGDVWTFTRDGTQPVDATYAAAGAAHLARTMPPALRPLRSPDNP